VLVKAGLLPTVDLKAEQQVTLTNNDSGKFEDRWVYLNVKNDSVSVFTRDVQEQIYLPVAHGEGKFVPKDESILKSLWQNRQIVFQYTGANGETGYPFNPNGSVDDIAGICDPTGRVLGMMPHPERYMDATNHPRWTRQGLAPEGDGVAIFRNAVKYFS